MSEIYVFDLLVETKIDYVEADSLEEAKQKFIEMIEEKGVGSVIDINPAVKINSVHYGDNASKTKKIDKYIN